MATTAVALTLTSGQGLTKDWITSVANRIQTIFERFQTILAFKIVDSMYLLQMHLTHVQQRALLDFLLTLCKLLLFKGTFNKLNGLLTSNAVQNFLNTAEKHQFPWMHCTYVPKPPPVVRLVCDRRLLNVIVFDSFIIVC